MRDEQPAFVDEALSCPYDPISLCSLMSVHHHPDPCAGMGCQLPGRWRCATSAPPFSAKESGVQMRAYLGITVPVLIRSYQVSAPVRGSPSMRT